MNNILEQLIDEMLRDEMLRNEMLRDEMLRDEMLRDEMLSEQLDSRRQNIILRLRLTAILDNTMIEHTNINNYESNQTNILCTLDDVDVQKLVKYSLTENSIEKCNICLDDMGLGDDVLKLDCDHLYHYNCINEYLTKYNYKCPCCRKEVGMPKYNL